MKKFAWLMGGLLLLILGGCLKLEEEITLNKDGSGEVKMTYAMSQQTIAQLKAVSDMGKEAGKKGEPAPAQEENPFEFDQTKVEEQFKALKEKGITLKSATTETKEGWQYVHLVFDFQDLSKLKETSYFKDDPITLTKNAEGNWVLSRPKVGKDIGPTGETEEQKKAMAAMFAGMRVVMKYNTPGAIISTTAPTKSEKSAEWVVDVDKDPSSISLLGKGKMEVVFEGKSYSGPEIKGEDQPEAPPEVQPEIKPETKSPVEPPVEPVSQPLAQPEAKTESQPSE